MRMSLPLSNTVPIHSLSGGVENECMGTVLDKGTEEREERWIQDREPRQIDGHVERLVPDLDAAFGQDAVLDVEMVVRRAELAGPSPADGERGFRGRGG